MADPQSNAPRRADAGTPASGVIHVRTRLTAGFTVLSNSLAQRPGSAITVGVAAYIASLRDGSSVTIATLCDHFSEGEILISRALRELEAAGYLERRRERSPSGQVRTRTYFYDVPGGDPGSDPGGDPGGPPEPPRPGGPAAIPVAPPPAATPMRASAPAPGHDTAEEPAPAPADAATAPAPAPAPAPTGTAGPPAPALADANPAAVAVLTALRRVDPRLVLSVREAARLAPAVAEWLAAGVGPGQITELLTVRLPDRFRSRPANVLAFRLRETPLPMPPQGPQPPPGERPAVPPFQTCDGCERAFRAQEPGHCRNCRDRLGGEPLRAAG
ncbi:hypothetical protein [Streptomyces pacificus]|uniref:Winged helix DNA-binding protein n=1 Tax=Streptomyces pacificus TaxID=2705029 RepID=A0A6A0AUP5_9ACTN|nr:hypothetical protein [Streptomyces pacificus]GFH36388.1 winged helix DNA-binding protein [Streptomyces pacificus]